MLTRRSTGLFLLVSILIMYLYFGVQANVSHPWLVPLAYFSLLHFSLRVLAASLACSLRLYSFLIIYIVGYMLSFVTAVELTAIAKSPTMSDESIPSTVSNKFEISPTLSGKFSY